MNKTLPNLPIPTHWSCKSGVCFGTSLFKTSGAQDNTVLSHGSGLFYAIRTLLAFYMCLVHVDALKGPCHRNAHKYRPNDVHIVRALTHCHAVTCQHGEYGSTFLIKTSGFRVLSFFFRYDDETRRNGIRIHFSASNMLHACAECIDSDGLLLAVALTPHYSVEYSFPVRT